MVGRVLGVLLLSAGVLGAAPAWQSTHDAVAAGMSCTQNPAGRSDCEYHVGRSLYFDIVAVGKKEAAITIYSSSIDGDYYATVSVANGCVIVKPGELTKGSRVDYVYISPRNGRAYADAESCGKATK